MLTSGSSRGRGDQPGAGVPPLTGLQHWHHHHSLAGRSGQPLKHAAQCHPGTALPPPFLIPCPTLQAGGANPAPGWPWPKLSWDPSLTTRSDLQPYLLGPQGPCGHFFDPPVTLRGPRVPSPPFRVAAPPNLPSGATALLPQPVLLLAVSLPGLLALGCEPLYSLTPSHLNPTGPNPDDAPCSLKAPPPVLGATWGGFAPSQFCLQEASH